VVPYRVQRVQYCVYDFVVHWWNGSTLAMYEPENTDGWKFRGVKSSQSPVLASNNALGQVQKLLIRCFMCSMSGRRNVVYVLHWKSLGFGKRECRFVWMCFHVGRKEQARTGTRTSISPSCLSAYEEALK
jgi:hypothetical protein